MQCGRRDEAEQWGNPPPHASVILVSSSKLFQFCEASEQAKGKEKHSPCGKYIRTFRMDFCPAGSPDLSEAEEAEIETIRQHREELLEDIKKLKEEIAQVFAEIEGFQNAEERQEADQNPGERTSKLSQRDKLLSVGRKKFNMDPEKGIQYLIEQQLLSSDLQEIAKFLHKGEGLNKTAIGDYLGGRDSKNIQILQAFVACHQFANLNLVQALRQFLWSFRLPGEAQKIDRMMEAFANWYCKCNPGVFQSTDTCYILSFSIIMLNTSLHNPNVKDKPPFERFVSINRGINDGADLPEELLKNCFELFNPNCKGQKIKACKTDGDGKVVEGKHQSYKISAATPAERDEWIEAIRTSITQNPFYDLVSARKKKIANKN
ncbi:cytohesin-4 isoform X2 [Coturnix japonica]|uniref:cytohesin-4 isoform X2 n=1 Tax=Coturnix japonica TaxID=93934 RepID=UPI0013A5E2EF|nr:cytohesin-4 isoform X2 [Coturnix japonica]